MQLINYKEIRKIVKNSKNIFIMGHKDIDLDALGSALGLYCYSLNYKKKAYIIIDDKIIESSSNKVLQKYNNKINIIKSNDIDKYFDLNSLLIIVDTNKKELLQNPKLIDKFYNILILDHHLKSKSSISLPNVKMIIDTAASSTCEMITDMLIYENIILDSYIATTILAGIVLDTNNFILKTTSNTYYCSYYLTKYGADPKEVQYLLKQDIKDYIERQKVITEVKIINKIAISKGLKAKKYRREDLAKIADTILLFDNIEASFVIGELDKKTIGISARSMGNVDVGKILETLSGGGDRYEAGAKITDKSIDEVASEIIKISKKIK